ncbi:MAG: ATP synthase F1 subunit delta [Clostridia bacterium]|nr:ATP synthase F1 subunit delta [Clostridia bacterium]
MTETSKEYAEALFALALEEGITEEISESLKIVLSQFRANPMYADFLASPNITVNDRVNAIDEAFSGSVHEYVLSFLKLLCRKDSIRCMYKAIYDYEDLFRESKGIAHARVISAVPLKSDEKTKLKAKLESLTGKKVEMECIHSSSVLGGIVVYVDGRVLDGSLRRRLHDLKEVIAK